MKLHELKYNEGARKEGFRVGRGLGSGNGKTSGSGTKGQNSRTGGGVRIGFEGGQNPIYRRISKRGFNNITRKEYAIVNVEDLNIFEDGAVVDVATLKEVGLVRKENDGVKILGNGELTKKLTVSAHKFSKSAVAKIEALQGTTSIL